MGWLFGHGQTRSQLIERLTRYEEHSGRTRRCLRHCTSGNVLWTVWEIARPDEAPMRYIGCDLLAWDKSCAGWGYKDMCEEMQPFYYSCPLAYLDMVPSTSPEWREQVRAWHATRSRALAHSRTRARRHPDAQRTVDQRSRRGQPAAPHVDRRKRRPALPVSAPALP